MNRMIMAGLGVAFVLLPAVASATGNVGCAIHDANLDFDFEALFGYGSDGGLFQVRAEIDVKSNKVPSSLKKVEMDGTHLKQQWFVAKDLKLLLLAESKDSAPEFGSVKLVIEAAQPPEEDFAYAGTYHLTLQNGSSGENEPLVVEGKVECSAG